MWHRPCEDNIPAMENIRNAPCGLRIKLLPRETASAHSLSRVKHIAMCVATRLDEHAVSTATHGPRMANVKERRDAAAEMPLPVMSYGPGSHDILSALSEFIIPSMIPTSVFASEVQLNAFACKTSYPTANTIYYCGSIEAASAGLTRKKLASNAFASSKNAAYRSRYIWSEFKPLTSTYSTSQRSNGTSLAIFNALREHPAKSKKLSRYIGRRRDCVTKLSTWL